MTISFKIAAALVMGLTLLSGCTATSALDGVSTGSTGGQHRYGDSEPIHDWEGGAPHGYPVHGVDVSKYQGTLDWNRLRQAGIQFAFIKATEGGDRVDERFADNWRAAQRAAVPRGAYHFYYFCRSARSQAQWFIENVPKERGALPPVLDMEWNHTSPSCKLRPAPAKVRSEMKVFLDRLHLHYGKRPIIYTTVDFYRDNIAGHFENELFWLRSVKAHPKVLYPGRPWAFWQYTGTGRIPGASGDIDINVFAGNQQQWRDWLEKATR